MPDSSYRHGLLDTPILLGVLQGDSSALRFVMDMLSHVGRIQFSEFSAMSLVAACQDAADRSQMLRFIDNSLVRKLTAPISGRALRILKSQPSPSALTADDAIVAATAVAHKLALYTLDPGRFAGVPGLSAIPPY